MARGLISFVCIVLVLASCAMLASAVSAATPDGRGPATISLRGPAVSGGAVGGSIEGAAPPQIEGEGPPIRVIVRLNGWILEEPELIWDPEEQAWTFAIDVPEGQDGGILTVTVVGGVGGGGSSATVRIGA